MEVKVSDKLYKQVEEITKHMNNVVIEEFVEHALYMAIKPYLNENHEISFTPARLETGESCYIVSNTSVFGKPYAVVLCDNQLIKVPKGEVCAKENS